MMTDIINQIEILWFFCGWVKTSKFIKKIAPGLQKNPITWHFNLLNSYIFLQGKDNVRNNLFLQKYHFFKNLSTICMDDRDMPQECRYVYIMLARSLIKMYVICLFYPALYFHQRKEYLFPTITHLSQRHWCDIIIIFHTTHMGHSSVPETLWSKPITANAQNQLTKTCIMYGSHIHRMML